jgi:hypothetical protein
MEQNNTIKFEECARTLPKMKETLETIRRSL